MTEVLTHQETVEYKMFEVQYEVFYKADLYLFLKENKFMPEHDTIYCRENEKLYFRVNEEENNDAPFVEVDAYMVQLSDSPHNMSYIREFKVDKFGVEHHNKIMLKSDTGNLEFSNKLIRAKIDGVIK